MTNDITTLTAEKVHIMESHAQLLEPIEHFVVLMLENRSLDCLLGYLYEEDTPTHFVPDDRREPFNGVAGKDLYNVADLHGPPGPDNPKIYVQKAPSETQEDMTRPNPDPGEDYPHVNMQLYGNETPSSFPYPAPMKGFVADYINALETTEGWENDKHPTFDDYKIIMNCFTPEAVPVLNGLARDFAVSDAWHCGVPSQTFCNRSFFNSASSHGFVTNADYVKWLKNDQPTIFNLLSANSVDWRVYWDQQDVFGSLTRLIHPPLFDKKFDANFRTYGHRYKESIPPSEDRFRKDCVAGDLPAYTFIEPRLFLNHNDMHPPVYINPGIDSSILAGELLVNKIYEDLFIYGAKRDQTLLLITFDEHGGTYDHASPPAATPPEKNPSYPLQDNFTFDRFGIRVPAILVSPWIQPGTVFRSGTETPLSHTSMIKTLCQKWHLKPDHLTDRDRAAPPLPNVLNAREPRKDMPTYKPRLYEPTKELHLNHSITSDLQRAILTLLAAKFRKEVPQNRSVLDVMRFMEDILQAEQRGCLFSFLPRLG